VEDGKAGVEGEVEGKKERVKVDEKVAKELCSRLDFYFSDVNMRRDKFMKGEVAKNDGYVELTTFLKFNRVKELTKETDALVQAVELSDNLELNEDETKVKRKVAFVQPSNSDSKLQTVYASGFPLDATIDDCRYPFVQLLGGEDKVAFVKMRREEGKFTGAVFAELATIPDANQVVKRKDELKLKDGSVLEQVQSRVQWGKEQDSKRKVQFDKMCVVTASGFSAACNRQNLKEVLGGDSSLLKWVDFVKMEGEEELCKATIRFETAEAAGAAVETLGKLDSAEKIGSPKDVRLLEGEEEEKYWTDFRDEMKKRNNNNNKKRGRGQGGKGNNKRRKA